MPEPMLSPCARLIACADLPGAIQELSDKLLAKYPKLSENRTREIAGAFFVLTHGLAIQAIEAKIYDSQAITPAEEMAYDEVCVSRRNLAREVEMLTGSRTLLQDVPDLQEGNLWLPEPSAAFLRA